MTPEEEELSSAEAGEAGPLYPDLHAYLYAYKGVPIRAEEI